MRITNLSEAQEAVAEIADFLNRFNQTLGALGNLTGQVNAPQIAVTSGGSQGHSIPAVAVTPTSGIPETMADRVLSILRESGRPMKPKEMTQRYTHLNWPPPPNGKLYATLLSCAFYMAKKGKLKNDGGTYSILP